MKEQGKQELPYRLENMTIPELEALLQQDFIALGGDAPDVDYIMQVVEVIQKKEKEAPGYQPVDTKAAWQEFKDFYNTQEGMEHSLYAPVEEPQKEVSKPEAVPSATPKQGRRLRWYYTVAALLAVMVSLTCIPVYGHPNIIQLVAHWSAETFTFMRSDYIDDTADDAPDNGTAFDSLERALIQYKINQPVVPTRFMDGFELVELKIKEFEASGKTEFYANYEQDGQFISISVVRYDSDSGKRAEINRDEEPDIYSCHGIDHYIFHNYDFSSISWHTDNLECSIRGTLPAESIEEMIDSIYERL